MSLPLAIDVAIGLLFIYLTLSLLASEIQELISTLLQWRAEHLKKSIQSLLTDPHLTNKLYATPLIQALNQEGTGRIVCFFRNISDRLTRVYYALTRGRSVFGEQGSGPSYIPSETFSIALLRQINVQEFSQKISELAVRKFGDEKLSQIQDILNAIRNSSGDYSLLEEEFAGLKRSLDDIIDDFANRRTTLPNSINRATEELQQFLNSTEAILANNNHCKEIVLRRLPYLKQSMLRRQLEPTVSEVLRLIFYIADNPQFHQTGNLDNSNLSAKLADLAVTLRRDHPQVLEQITALPGPLRSNLLALAEHAQIQTQSLEAGVLQLEQEVAQWFDNSMARASGVYKRNAKGVAIILGFLIAIAVNADTLYIVGRLSKDSTLRATISQAADQIAFRNAVSGETQTNLNALKDEVDAALDDLPLPIGWNTINLERQLPRTQFGGGFNLLRMIAGWGITGIALSMGASFWYDLLSKIMRVRNSGRSEGSK